MGFRYKNGSDWPKPAVTDKRVYIGAVGVLHFIVDHHRGFFAVDRATGHLVWTYPMPPQPGSVLYGVASSPEVYDRRVFFGALDGVLYGFSDDNSPVGFQKSILITLLQFFPCLLVSWNLPFAISLFQSSLQVSKRVP
jgi:hypothetical protein